MEKPASGPTTAFSTAGWPIDLQMPLFDGDFAVEAGTLPSFSVIKHVLLQDPRTIQLTGAAQGPTGWQEYNK